MNFYKKYLKYKNKYLILKGGDFQLRPSFIEKIENIIKYIKNICYKRSVDRGNFDTKIVINRLIFNILLYGGFIFRKETIIDGDIGQSRLLIDNNGIFFNNEQKIIDILNENYIFNSSNPNDISCEVKIIIDLLKKYSNYYYDNYPEIFNYNNNVIPSKTVNDYNLNDLFCLLFMIIKDNTNSDTYFCLLKQIKYITIFNQNYMKLDLNIVYSYFNYNFKKNLINSNPMDNLQIFNSNNNINVADLININFNKSTTNNKYFLFNIPNLMDTSEENILNESDYPRIFDNRTLFLVYNEDDVNDFNLFINFDSKNVKINNLIKNIPDIFYIVKCAMPYNELIDYYYHQVYIDPYGNIDNITYDARNYADPAVIKTRDGIKENIRYDEIDLLSSYWDSKENPECKKDTFSRTAACIYSPLLTDHSGFLVKFRNGQNIIKFLSLNIAEYQETKRGSAAMPVDEHPLGYFSRIKSILYLLIKILKKEDIECCFLQELFKVSDSNHNLTLDKKNTIFSFIRGYLNLYDYDIQEVLHYNNIIYKKNYQDLTNNIISREKFTSILIGDTSMCSLKFSSSEARSSSLIKFYLICIFATIFNTYDICNEIIIMGDFNFRIRSGNLLFIEEDRKVCGPAIDHALVIGRDRMLAYINSLNFEIIFDSIVRFIRTNLSRINNAANPKRRGGILSPNLQINLLNFTGLNFSEFNQIYSLITQRHGLLLENQVKNKYNFLVAIFYLYYEFLSAGNNIVWNEFDLTNFHDFTNAQNLECLFSGADDGSNHGYIWHLLQFIYLLGI
jgi:hypothetical protein